MFYTNSQLDFLQAVIVFAANLKIVNGAATPSSDLEQALTNATQALRSVKRLLITVRLTGNRRASFEKWIQQAEEDLQVLGAAQVSDVSPVPSAQPVTLTQQEMSTQPAAVR